MATKGHVPWGRIDIPLVIAAMAETTEQRNAEYYRISRRFEISTRSLKARLRWLQVRHVEPRMGYAAVDQWRKEMLMLAQAFSNPIRMKYAIESRYDVVRRQIGARQKRPLTMAQAAQMLGITVSLLKVFVDDLQVLQRDEKGRLTVKAIREFYEREGRSLLVRYNVIRRNRPSLVPAMIESDNVPRGTASR